MYAIVGHCPHCGAPIYAESPYWSILPPPSIYSCNCVPHGNVIYKTNTNYDLTVDDSFPKQEYKYVENQY